MQSQTMIRCGAVLGALAVAAGAFGAHGLKDVISEHDLRIFHTGVEYQFYHVAALVLCGVLVDRGWRSTVAAWSFLTGTIIFSSTLYAIAFGAPKWLGAITPIGGVLLMVGWVALALSRRPGQPL